MSGTVLGAGDRKIKKKKEQQIKKTKNISSWSLHVNYLASLTLRFLFHKLGIIVPPVKAFVKIQ